MIVEEPPLKKCCYFIPLSWCLHTWALIKVLLDIVVLSYLGIVITFLYSFCQGRIWKFYEIYLLGLIVVILLVDVGFHIALMTGVFMKSLKTLRVFHFYEFFMMAVEIIIVAAVSLIMIQQDMAQGLISTVVGIFYLFINVLIDLTVKSEMIKLRNKEQYDFSRMQIKTSDVEGIDNAKFKAEE